MNLSKHHLPEETTADIPSEDYFNLPEKILQFGTGVLLRGLPDYFVDKANKQQVFNGRIVVVKSTGTDTGDFDKQNGVYAHRICGIEDGRQVNGTVINASISRVLAAQTHWQEIMQCAANPDMEIVISNTTEVGIVLTKDDIHSAPPVSYPGKLLAFLVERYNFFKGAADKGLVIIPTELITDNGKKLKEIIIELARQNHVDENCVDWIKNHNHFCSSLVDRIVPGKLSVQDKEALEKQLGYQDDLAIISEPYCLWAIESGDRHVKDVLSFSKADKGVIIAPDIALYRELKLRLLNGTHTFSCGPAFLAGFNTVKETMDDRDFSSYIESLMRDEIAPAITGSTISSNAAATFSSTVLDRFRNPFIEHKWLSITLQYSSKMAMRNVPLILSYVQRFKKVPQKMAEGFAAHILFMKCAKADNGKYYGVRKGEAYPVNDDNAAFYAAAWKNNSIDEIVSLILSNSGLWQTDLNNAEGFADAVTAYLRKLISKYESVS